MSKTFSSNTIRLIALATVFVAAVAAITLSGGTAFAEQTGSGVTDVYVDLSAYGQGADEGAGVDQNPAITGNETFRTDVGAARTTATVVKTTSGALPKTGDPTFIAGALLCGSAIIAAFVAIAYLARRRAGNDGKHQEQVKE